MARHKSFLQVLARRFGTVQSKKFIQEKMKRVILFLVFGVSLFSGGWGGAPCLAKDTALMLKTRDCPHELEEATWSGWSAACYRLQFPILHPSKLSSFLDIVVLRSALRNEEFAPLFFLGRGLGFSLEHHIEQLSGLASSALLLQRDIVIVQGRGSGLVGEHFSCPGLENAILQGVLAEKWNSSLSAWTKGLKSCLKERVRRYSLQDTTLLQAARDIETVRRLLKYPKIQIWANGEGVLWAWLVAQIAEDHVSAMVLNGWWSEISPSEQVKSSLMSFAEGWVASCQKDTFCHHAFPKIREKFLHLLKRVSKKSIRVPLPSYGNEPARTFLLHRQNLLLFLFRLSKYKELAPFFPLLINELEQGRLGLLKVLASLLLPHYLRKVATGAYLGALCSMYTQPELVPLWKLRVGKDLSADPQLDLAPSGILPAVCGSWPSSLQQRLSLHKVSVRTLWLDRKKESAASREKSWFGHFFFHLQPLQRTLYAPEDAMHVGCPQRIAFAFLEGRKLDATCFFQRKRRKKFLLRREEARLASVVMGDEPWFLGVFFLCILVFASVMVLKPLSFSFQHWRPYLPKRFRDFWEVGSVERPIVHPYISNPYARQEEPRGMPLTAYLSRWWAIFEVFFLFLFVLLFLQKIFLEGYPVSLFFLRRSLGGWFGVALIATVGAHVMFLFSVLSWMNHYWSLWARIHYAIVSVAALVFVWMLHAVGVLGGVV